MRYNVIMLMMVGILGCESPEMREDRRILEEAVEPTSSAALGLVELCAFVRQPYLTGDCIRSQRCWHRPTVPTRTTAWSSRELNEIRDHRELFGFAGFERGLMSFGSLDQSGVSGRYTVIRTRLFRTRYASLPRCH